MQPTISQESDSLMKGADLMELLLGITKKIGYYAITATKKNMSVPHATT